MKILLSTGIFPNKSDINRGIYIWNQARALRKLCDVKVIAPVPYFPSFINSKTYSPLSTIPASDALSGIPARHPKYFVTPKILRSLHGWFLAASVYSTYRKIIREYKPDVILGFHAYPYGFANVVLGRRFKIPVVTGCIGSDINYLSKRYWQGKRIKWALEHSHRVLSVSSALKNEILKLGIQNGHVAVITNGVATDLFHPIEKQEARRAAGLAPDGKLCVFVGRLSHEKGVDVLLRALPHTKTPGLSLCVVGSGPEESSLRAATARLKITGKVIFAGPKRYDEIPTWINAADVFILPSRNEGHPNVVLESLACGVPVVATRVGGVAEILTSDDHGTIVEPDDPMQLARAVDDALSREWDRGTLSGHIRRSWDTVAEEVLEEIHKCLNYK